MIDFFHENKSALKRDSKYLKIVESYYVKVRYDNYKYIEKKTKAAQNHCELKQNFNPSSNIKLFELNYDVEIIKIINHPVKPPNKPKKYVLDERI